MAQVYDVLGLVCPYTIVGKIALQELWAKGVGWDSIAPEEVLSKWQKYVNEMPLIQEHPIPRHTSKFGLVVAVSLHGFSDASELAFW